MWFVGVQKDFCHSRIIPWYHELYDPQISSRAITVRKKKVFDESLVIRTEKDIEKLSEVVHSDHTNVRRVRIQPMEEKLLRNKDTLRRIGELTQKIKAVILLEGGVLSHAYYQLIKTNAIVEVLHPFEDVIDKREFNKLVRDKVPSNILHGEVVKQIRLSGELLLKALRNKLVEESFEVLEAVDQQSIIDELADVTEIIDGILAQLRVSRKDLQNHQDQKRAKAGGFKDGLILIETENPIPTRKQRKEETLFTNEMEMNTFDINNFMDRSVYPFVQTIDKWSDLRKYPSLSESILKILVPLVEDTWEINTSVLVIDSDMDDSLKLKGRIKGKRIGSKLEITVSILRPHKQLTLF